MTRDRETPREALASALISEAVSFGSVLLVVYAIGHRDQLQRAATRARRWVTGADGRESEAAALAQVQREISLMEHGS